jgi:hypothetical protein
LSLSQQHPAEVTECFTQLNAAIFPNRNGEPAIMLCLAIVAAIKGLSAFLNEAGNVIGGDRLGRVKYSCEEKNSGRPRPRASGYPPIVEESPF